MGMGQFAGEAGSIRRRSRGTGALAAALWFVAPVAGADKAPVADAYLFAESAQVMAGTCFPKFHLELWDANVPHVLSERHASKSPMPVPACDATRIGWDELRTYFRTPHGGAPGAASAWVPPRLAVTLEGGGSKSAPFSLGALAGLHESGLLSEVDIISSVSGGSYAAYFYFSRLLDAQRGAQPDRAEDANALFAQCTAGVDPQRVPGVLAELREAASAGARDPNAWFKDCTPSIYRDRFGASNAGAQRFCSGPAATVDDIVPFACHFPYQAHVRFYQDLVHWRGGLEQVDQNFGDRVSTYSNVGFQFLQHLVTAPVHFLMNSVFAMPENSSPSRFAYRSGIERAYAHTMRSWDGASSGKSEHSGGELSERTYLRQYSMQDLAGIVGANPCSGSGTPCKGPLWIANATASSGRDLTTWLSIPSNDALRANFEMTPFGQGSGVYGFVNRPVTMPLRDVVGSSAAFLDRDQREFGLGAFRLAAGAAISFLNLEWGSDIPNYNATDAARGWAHLTPIPLYHVPASRQQTSPTIHLADGGNTDNLGVLSALRRGAQNIIVIAATGDGTGRMKSLCRAKNHLELDGTYRVSMPELIGIDRVCSGQIGDRELAVWGEETITKLVCETRKATEFCVARDDQWHWNPDAKAARGYDMWNWPIPVLQGAVVRDDAWSSQGVRVIARIYLVKPAIYQSLALQQLGRDSDNSPPERLCELDDSYKVNRCSSIGPRQRGLTGVTQPVAMPCTAIAFAAAGDCRPNTNHGTFPQHDVVFTTLNSSYTLFGAYYDLARHVTSQIGRPERDQPLRVPPSLGEKWIRPLDSGELSTSGASQESANP